MCPAPWPSVLLFPSLPFPAVWLVVEQIGIRSSALVGPVLACSLACGVFACVCPCFVHLPNAPTVPGALIWFCFSFFFVLVLVLAGGSFLILGSAGCGTCRWGSTVKFFWWRFVAVVPGFALPAKWVFACSVVYVSAVVGSGGRGVRRCRWEGGGRLQLKPFRCAYLPGPPTLLSPFPVAWLEMDCTGVIGWLACAGLNGQLSVCALSLSVFCFPTVLRGLTWAEYFFLLPKPKYRC